MAIGVSLLAADLAEDAWLLLMVVFSKMAHDQYSHTSRVSRLFTRDYYMGPGCA
jgi:hypothetical protein